MHLKPSKQAQSIIELAVFGSVLFFLIAGIASVYVNGSFQQNGMLQATRIAFSKSYETSKAGRAARTGAAYYLYEDRLSGDVGKFGSNDRQAIMLSGSGSLTNNMMLPIDFSETANLPIMDVQINGQAFEFTTSAFINYKFLFDGSNAWIYSGSPAACPGAGLTDLNSPETAAMRERLSREWATYGGPPAYTNIVRNNTALWNTLDNDRMYDYNRNGPGHSDDFPASYRDNNATWQWYWKSMAEVAAEINVEDGSYPSYDINGDLQEEIIYALPAATPCTGYTATYAASVLTPGAGDWNTEKQREDYADPNDVQGMRGDMRIYSQMQCTAGDPGCANGFTTTYLDVKEGRRYSTDGSPVNVSVVQKSQFDVVERIIQLNKQMVDPGGFITRNPSVELTCSNVNPGGSCCGESANLLHTCFDQANKILYVRSRISDKRGRKWITSTDEDYYQTLGLKP